MTQEEKELLLKVLCAMLPYGVICYAADNEYGESGMLYSVDPFEKTDPNIYIQYRKGNVLSFFTSEVKPYLRPMSSMTKEEKQESRWYRKDAKSDNFILYMNRYVEWLDSKHFDWRTDGNGKTMIEIGLALEAPEGLYEIK